MRRKQCLKEYVLKVCYVISSLMVLWLLLSFIDVNAHNLSDQDYASWNVIHLIMSEPLTKEADAKTGITAADLQVQITEASAETRGQEAALCLMQKQINTKLRQEERAAEKEAAAKAAKKEEKLQKKVLLLAKALYAENGNSEQSAILTGVVILKRVKSEDYPNTIRDVLSQPGQYATWKSGTLQACEPNEMCMEIAEELLRFGLADDYPDNLLYQSEFVQGAGVYQKIGNEYFCLK